MEMNERFLTALSTQDKKMLEVLAKSDGLSMAGVLRMLIRREARNRGLLPAISQLAHGLPVQMEGG
jgi:hypothetical protein